MTVTDNDLAAFADGQLAPADALRIEQELFTDPVLADRLAAHRTLKSRLAAHFDPILAQVPPDRLTAMLRGASVVTDLATTRQERAGRARLPRWTKIAGPTLAATVLLAVFVPDTRDGKANYADAQLAEVLNSRLVAEQDSRASTRILLSFTREAGEYCRTYVSADESGIACRDSRGWAIVEQSSGAPADQGDYQQAGASTGELMARAQDMAAGSALDAVAERAARERGWQK